MWRVALLFLANPALADAVIATRAIAANAIIGQDDVTAVQMDIPNAATRLDDVIGMQTLVGIAAGRILPANQLVQPLRIERNSIVALVLKSGGMEIRTEGRALSAGGVGDVIEIMNISSRSRLSGKVAEDGSILVRAQR